MTSRVRSLEPARRGTRVCSRCYGERPVAEFRGHSPGSSLKREFKTCVRCREQLRDLMRAQREELRWLRAEAMVPYAERPKGRKGR